MQAIELNRLDLFFLVNPTHIKGTASNVMYQVEEVTNDGIIAHGLIQTPYGSTNLSFYLPNCTEVAPIEFEDIA